MSTLSMNIARQNMINTQLKVHNLNDPDLLTIFNNVPRELFFAKGTRSFAYTDCHYSIDLGRFILSPYACALLLKYSDIQPDQTVLVLGNDRGYMTSLLAHVASTVLWIHNGQNDEIDSSYIHNKLGLNNIVSIPVKSLDKGYPDEAPFHHIVIAGGIESVPHALLSQLSARGKIVTYYNSSHSKGLRVILKHGTSHEMITKQDISVPSLMDFKRLEKFDFDKAM